MKSLLSILFFSVVFLVSNLSFAREFNDKQFPDRIQLSGSDITLQLNGVGMRTKFIFDIYVGALYTENAAKTRKEVQAQAGPKRILMHFVYDEVSAEKLVAGWNAGFEENNSEEVHEKLKSRIDQFNAMFVTVVKDDVVLLDYVPGEGTRVKIKGEQKGIIPGEDFNKALLDIWLGEEPADDDLKDAMLGYKEEE